MRLGKYKGDTIESILKLVESGYPFEKQTITWMNEASKKGYSHNGCRVIFSLNSLIIVDYRKPRLLIDKEQYPYMYSVQTGNFLIYDVYNVKGKPHYKHSSNFSAEGVKDYLLLLYKCWELNIKNNYAKSNTDSGLLSLTTNKKLDNFLETIHVYASMRLYVEGLFEALTDNCFCVTTLKNGDKYYHKHNTNTDLGGSLLCSSIDVIYLKAKYQYNHELRGIQIFKRNRLSKNVSITQLDTVGRNISNVDQLRKTIKYNYTKSEPK